MKSYIQQIKHIINGGKKRKVSKIRQHDPYQAQRHSEQKEEDQGPGTPVLRHTPP